jgi:hypothetical protein
MQSGTRCTTADHIMPSSAIYDESGNVIATHEHGRVQRVVTAMICLRLGGSDQGFNQLSK